MMASQLAQAWWINHEITLSFLDRIPEETLEDRYSPRTRTVAAQFAHIHYVRVRNLGERGGPSFLGDLAAFPKGAQPTKEELRRALEASGAALADLVEHFEARGEVKAWGGPPATYLAYLVAHEAHHRALAVVAMRLSGHRAPQEVTHNLWYEWRRKRSEQ